MTKQELIKYRASQVAEVRAIVDRHGDGVRPSYVSADLAICHRQIWLADQELAKFE